MKVVVYDTHRFEVRTLREIGGRFGHSVTFLEPRLRFQTASLAQGHEVVCSFANDSLNADTLQTLKSLGIQLIALRCAGFNHVDLTAAARLGLPVVRVPAYSPHAVAEHAVALILTLNRKTHRAFSRVRDLNFSLEGLIGFDLFGKTIGLVGTGRIGGVMTTILNGFGCRVIAVDSSPRSDLNVSYVSPSELYRESDVISLHLPLTAQSRHMINRSAIDQMKSGVMVINTSRGALIETRALIDGLKSGKIGSAGLDVYEEEEDVFFHDLSETGVKDDLLARLLTFPNVLITAHQGFCTREALDQIAQTTFESISDFEAGRPLRHAVLV